jgi:hypothetical protein
MHRWLPALLIVALLAAFRVLGAAFPTQFPNLQPLLGLLLCSVVFLKGIQRWLLPLAVWLVTDPFTSVLQGYPVFGWHHFGIAIGVAATLLIARYARRQPTAISVLCSVALSAVAFYFLTNLLSFAIDPLYVKNFTGFAQAEWTGAPGSMPTWVFLRNGLAGNLAFTGLFLAALFSLPQQSPESARVLAR